MCSMFHIIRFVFIFLFLVESSGHSRWKCPTARSSNTGMKLGPCGGDRNGDFDTNGRMELKPGRTTLIFEESVSHGGAPFRIALSQEGSDTYDCVLLNHIPHNDAGRPNYYYPSTFIEYRITVDIPDVRCERCALQLINPMTDKIAHGSSCLLAPSSTPNYCFSVYHSCANVNITGKNPRSGLNCSQPNDWPFKDMAATVYTQETQDWKNGYLTEVSSNFTMTTGPCFPDNTALPPSSGTAASDSGNIIATSSISSAEYSRPTLWSTPYTGTSGNVVTLAQNTGERLHTPFRPGTMFGNHARHSFRSDILVVVLFIAASTRVVTMMIDG